MSKDFECMRRHGIEIKLLDFSSVRDSSPIETGVNRSIWVK